MRVDLPAQAGEPEGQLVADFEGGKNVWVEEGKIKQIEKLFQDVLEIIEIVKKRGVQIWEQRYTEKEY